MHELEHKAKKELEKIAQQGLTTSNLEIASKLVDIVKDIHEIDDMEMKGQYSTGRYSGYRDYRDGYRNEYQGDYRERGYRGNDRMTRGVDRLVEGADMYRAGRERYMQGGNKEQVLEGLENMMYAICSLVESGMDLAETAEEKEIIRKHIKKLQSL